MLSSTLLSLAPVVEVNVLSWSPTPAGSEWITALESGKILHLPRLRFTPGSNEQALLTPALLDSRSRNISLDAQDMLKGTAGPPEAQTALRAMMLRFRAQSIQLVRGLFPRYAEAMQLAPASYRPVEVESRVQSRRADDRLLHVDAFPSRPNRGVRILRVFTNIHPAGKPRVWRVGEPFEDLAEQFLPQAKPYSPRLAALLERVGITKSRRSEYDHLMLQLHDAMKSDTHYQRYAPQVQQAFAPGSTWICFSDQTAHAAVSGQYLLEHTFHLPVEQQYDPASSPLAILTRLTGRQLV